jgi:hypothetical protein
MCEHGLRGVVQPEPADDDIEAGSLETGEPEPRQFDFAAVNRLDIKNSSPSFISKISMPVESCRCRRRLRVPIAVGRKSSSSKFELMDPLPDGGTPEGVPRMELSAITARTGNSSPGKLARPHYSFRAPAVKAPTTNFWKTTKIAIAGSSDNMLAAATSCVAEPV